MSISLDDSRSRLRELEFFHECDDDDLERVAALAETELTFEDGDVLFEEGDPARDCYVIVDGEADVTVAGRFVGSIGEGESVGEMGLLDREPRAATVIARTPMVVQVIEAAAFDALVEDAPSVTLALLRQVSRRLRAMDEKMARLAALASETTIDVGDTPPTPKAAAAAKPARIGLDPEAPGFYEDPYSQYAALREHDPIHFDEAQGTWLVTRYEDVLGVGRNKALSVEIADAAPGPYVDGEKARLARMEGRLTKMMVSRNAPDHTRMRKQVYRQFTPKAVKALRERMQTWVDTALERIAEKGECELIEDFAFPLPLVVISEMLGMPAADGDQIRDWSQAITKAIDQGISDAEAEASIAGCESMAAYLGDVIEAKRKKPAEDLLSVLVAVSSDQLSHEELVDQVMLLYVAGHETTVNLIGNGTLALLRNPEQLERLRRDPALEANAIEELLRYDSPAQFTRRIVREKTEIGGRALDPGAVIFSVLGSANRDPEKFGADADRLDVARKGAHEHVSFGGGAHHCLGASLVRLEGLVALPSLLRRFPRMELAGEASFAERMTLRGLAKLPLVLGT